MASTETGVHFPQGTDSFAPHSDMQALAESLDHKVAASAANSTEANALRDALSPSAADPLFVWRSDLRLLTVSMGAGFTVVNLPSSETSIPTNSGVSGSITLYRSGNSFTLRGRVIAAASSTPGATRNLCASGAIPLDMRPPSPTDGIAYQQVSSATQMPMFGLLVDTTGSVVLTVADKGNLDGSAAIRFAVPWVRP